jgi:ABC-type dipeptide/oligopeptide/nickel transport system ATPase component
VDRLEVRPASGSGKTLTGLSLLRLLPRGAGRIESGSLALDGRELSTLTETEMAREVRGRRIAMIMQDPMTSLNPVFSIAIKLPHRCAPMTSPAARCCDPR